MCSTQARDLIRLSIHDLGRSAREADPAKRFTDAQLAALRAAAAIVADRSAAQTRPAATIADAGNAEVDVRGEAPASRGAPRSKATNVWQLLTRFAPELSEWAALFSFSADKRMSVNAGTAAVSAREADDSLRDSATFVSRVAALLGLGTRQLDLSTQFLVAT